MLIFDIGVNNGEFTREALLRYPEAKVIGVDPSPASVSNIPQDLWTDERFEFVYRAASDEDGQTLNFYLDPTQTGIGTISKKWMTDSRFAKGSTLLKPNSGHWGEKPIQVRSITLDSLIKSYGKPDYVKVDVEGYEYEVFKGLSEKVGLITFEWSEEDMEALTMCVSRLMQLGYTEFAVTGFFAGKKKLGNLLQHDDRGDEYFLEPKKWASLERFMLSLRR